MQYNHDMYGPIHVLSFTKSIIGATAHYVELAFTNAHKVLIHRNIIVQFNNSILALSLKRQLVAVLQKTGALFLSMSLCQRATPLLKSPLSPKCLVSEIARRFTRSKIAPAADQIIFIGI